MHVLLLLLCLWQALPHKQNSQPHKVAQDARSQQQEIPPSPAPVQNSYTYNHTQRPTEEKQRAASEPSGWWVVGITAIYTIVSGFTLWFIVLQVISIQRIERAFLIPVWDNLVHISYGIGNETPREGAQKMHHTFAVNFRNCGKTPAFIRGVTAEIILIPSLDSLPSKPSYGPLVPFAGDPIVPGATTESPFCSPIKDGRPFDEIEAEYRTKRAIFFVVGVVKYDDVFGRSHQTRYGLRYRAAPQFDHQFDCFVIDGPKKYNEYT